MSYLYQGLYDLLATEHLREQLEDSELEACFEAVSEANLPEHLAGALANRVKHILAEIKRGPASDKAAAQIAWLNQLLAILEADTDAVDRITTPPRMLRALHPKGRSVEQICTGR